MLSRLRLWKHHRSTWPGYAGQLVLPGYAARLLPPVPIGGSYVMHDSTVLASHAALARMEQQQFFLGGASSVDSADNNSLRTCSLKSFSDSSCRLARDNSFLLRQ